MRVGKVSRSMVYVIIIVLSIPCAAVSTIYRKALVTSPEIKVLNRPNVLYLTLQAWQEPVDLFSRPSALCLISDPVYIGSVKPLFVVDKSDRRIHVLDIWYDSVTHERSLEYIQAYAPGDDLITPIAATADCGDYDRDPNLEPDYKLYVADLEADRVVKLDYSNYGDNRLTFESYVGEGLLNDPSDVEFCDMPGENNDFLIVADAGNNRVLLFNTSGEVIQTIGSTQPGSGNFQFHRPVAATAQRINDLPTSKAAYIYVADAGNNKLVWIVRNDSGDLEWRRSLNVPGSVFRSIDVDDNRFTGLYVVDDGYNLKYYGYDLEHEIEGFSDLVHPTDLCVNKGEIGIAEMYSNLCGLQLLGTNVSINDACVSPTKFVPPLEWAKITFKSTCLGYATIRVYKIVNQTEEYVATICEEAPCYPDECYYLWDGSNCQIGSYKIKIWLTNYYDPEDVALKELPVSIVPSQNYVTIETSNNLQNPQWSPDGRRLAFQKQIPGTNYSGIYTTYLANKNDTLLTGTTYHAEAPSWSPDGSEIVWLKRMTENAYTTHAVNRATRAIRRISQDQAREKNPRFTPQGEKVSYFDYDYAGLFRINSSDGGAKELLLREPVFYHDWSPYGAELAFVYGTIETNQHIWKYDVGNAEMTQMTFQETGNWEPSVAWSPSGKELLYTTCHWIHSLEDWRWDLMAMPSTGGEGHPVGGIGSDDVTAQWGLDFSPDNTKAVFSVSTLNPNMFSVICADVHRSSDAYPSVNVTDPAEGKEITRLVSIKGTVDDNVSVNGVDTLSQLLSFRIEYGMGFNPVLWNSSGVQYDDNAKIQNGTIGTWDTRQLPAGLYTLRIVATDGTDENVASVHVNVVHTVYVVAKDGSGDFTSIQPAIDAADIGDTIKVGAGDYSGGITMKQGVTLRALGTGVRIVNATASGVTITNHSVPCRIDGFTIYNCSSQSYGGGGIRILNSSPIIENCVIHYNSAGSGQFGGGTYIGGNSSPQFSNCTIDHNSGTYGGAIFVMGTTGDHPAPQFDNCAIAGNSSSSHGGAIYFQLNDPEITLASFNQCIISDNHCGQGTGSAAYIVNAQRLVFAGCLIASCRVDYAGSGMLATIFAWSAPPILNSCTVAGNDFYTTQDVWVFRGIYLSEPITVQRCIIANNGGHIPTTDQHFTIRSHRELER